MDDGFLAAAFFLAGVWARALPAADLDVLLVRPSFSVLEAAVAAFLEVVFLGALVWESALPAVDPDLEYGLLLGMAMETLETTLLPIFICSAFNITHQFEA